MSPPHPQRPPKRWKRLGLVAIVVLAAAVIVAVMGISGRESSEAKLQQWTDTAAVLSVHVVTPQLGVGPRELVLPGDVEAFYQAPIHARVSGYLQKWYEDIGAKVKVGQLLAEIDAPDIDQQYAQAKGNLATAEANAKLADLTAKRWQALRASDSVSQQTSDEKAGDAAAKKASVTAAQAEVQRLAAMENFKRITAPFDGVVTARRTDIGDLISAGGSIGPELFSVADIHRMRIYVRVPQAFAAELQPGMSATMKLPQYPGQSFTAKLITTSNAISPESRTILVELQADNADGKLLPGTYAEIHFELPQDPHTLRLPTSALLFREHGLEVATVGPQDKVVLRPIEVGRDLGTEVEVTSGLEASDRVIDSPSDSISTGETVRVGGSDQPPAKVVAQGKAAGPGK